MCEAGVFFPEVIVNKHCDSFYIDCRRKFVLLQHITSPCPTNIRKKQTRLRKSMGLTLKSLVSYHKNVSGKLLSFTSKNNMWFDICTTYSTMTDYCQTNLGSKPFQFQVIACVSAELHWHNIWWSTVRYTENLELLAPEICIDWTGHL